MNNLSLFTSESVTEGHPDKVADQISDALVDAMIEADQKSRVAIETLLTNGICFIAGEVTTSAYIDIAKVARETIREIGYTDAKFGFHWQTSGVAVAIKEQSSDIALGVDAYKRGLGGKIVREDLTKLGAGDQGLMFGYASNETPEYMPLPIVLAHELTKRLSLVRKKGIVTNLRPDGKSQVTLEYNQSGQPYQINTILLAVQHDENKKLANLRQEIEQNVIKPVVFDPKFSSYPWQKRTKDNWSKVKIIINGTGRFVIGGPQADTGLTGRKIIVDSYGGMGRHGGGCFSGKDPTKVDRSGSYAARWVAKNVVAAGLASRAEVQISYAIGVPQPLSIRVDSFGSAKLEDHKIARAIGQVFDLRPGLIIQTFNLRRPIYRQLASYGHFGRPDLNLPWEKTDRVKQLKQAINP